MRYGILIEKNTPVRIKQDGTRARGGVVKHRAITPELKDLLDAGEVGLSVYISVYEADEEGNFIPGGALVHGSTYQLPEVYDVFARYQVDTETGIGKPYVKPVKTDRDSDVERNISADIDAAVASAVGLVAEQLGGVIAELKAEIADLKAGSPPTVEEADANLQDELRAQYSDMTNADLLALCETKGIEGVNSKSTKDELVEALLNG